MVVDFVGRFERLDSDFNQVAARIGTPSSLGHHNRSRPGGDDYRRYYDQRTADLVGDFYRCDLDAFGYEFSSPG